MIASLCASFAAESLSGPLRGTLARLRRRGEPPARAREAVPEKTGV
ncbi:hypothetical protein ACFQQB_27240 [Nonomuraea rubra]